MINKNTLKVNNSIIRIVGVFEPLTTHVHYKGILESNGYKNVIIKDEASLSFYKNYWYPEFRDLLFIQEKETSAKIFFKHHKTKVDFVIRKNPAKGGDELLEVQIENVELFTFRHGLNLFSVEVSIKEKELNYFSDLTNALRKFNQEIIFNNNKTEWLNWVEEYCLCGVEISSKPGKKPNKVDEFSGSKFKLYTVLDLEEDLDIKTREELLYDFGCVTRIGTAGSTNEALSPSEHYYKEILKNKISVFTNYDILTLFDTFTVIGKDIIDHDPNSTKRKTWTETYFRIYLYSLFIKFHLFKYNSEVLIENVGLRDSFEEFIATYNLSKISYNFLPNKIFHQIRESNEIDLELKQFQQRISKINQLVQEKQQKRTNLLLALFTIITFLSDLGPAIDLIERIKRHLPLNNYVFNIYLIITLSISVIILFYLLFPHKFKKYLRKWKKHRK